MRDGRTEGQTEGGVEGGRVCDSLQTTPACHQIHRTMVKNADDKVILI